MSHEKDSGYLAGLSNLNKIFWPNEGYTKGDVVNYYNKIADVILKYLQDRPQNLNRHPNGITKKNFFQKDVNSLPPEWADTVKIYSKSNKKEICYLMCQDKPTLLYMANLGCIELNPWNARHYNINKPDYAIIDLDPNDISFKETIKTALAIKKLLDSADVRSFCKTSGGRGLHIFIPLGGKYHYKNVVEFTRIIGLIIYGQLPDIVSLERSPQKRKGRVYFDYLQNNKEQTIVCAYSLRPKAKATVSTPLKWQEVKDGLDPNKFNVETIFNRLKKYGDLWEGVLGPGINIEMVLQKFKRLSGN